MFDYCDTERLVALNLCGTVTSITGVENFNVLYKIYFSTPVTVATVWLWFGMFIAFVSACR